MRRIFLLGAAAVATACAIAPAAAPALAAAPAPVPTPTDSTTPSRPVEVFAEDGTITRARVPATAGPKARSLATSAAKLTPVEVNGPSANRIDLVFVGDGYTGAELGVYGDQVAAKWALLSGREPFKSYRRLFNVWRVDIPSPTSGVSGDPARDVVRNTPLGMTFWCDGLERLLCVNEERAKAYAALAPDMDQIAAMANSVKYGGAGYTDEEMATFSGGNERAGEVLPHELGHSLGDLADEYDYYAYPGDGSRYDGPEFAEVNVSVRDAERMRAERAKWWYWLGAPSPDGDVVGAYEGGYYTQYGVYRPTSNSLMKSLGREFNSVGREKMIQSFYAIARPIDAHTPDDLPVGRKSTLSVTPAPIPTLSVRWYRDGREHRPWRGRTSVEVNGMGDGGTVTAVVSDGTADVRDPDYREKFLTQSVTWTVRGNH
ncbi:M64 family metallopeptidase [Streptosporangium sp. CA-135522]|uniref:M64 family metallopeptidase n=1 Tax=Streptosporangium sp. CA-135522 TaxID=3240072 RepID=UPI003D8CDE39